MAFEDVELTAEEKAALTQSFISLDSIGQVFTGRLVRTQPQTGQYAKKNAVDYVFKYKNPAEGLPGHRAELAVGAVVEGTLKSQADINQKLGKAKPEAGHVIRVQYLSDLDIGKENPMKIYKVQIDRSPPKAGATAAPPPPPPPPAADDVDF